MYFLRLKAIVIQYNDEGERIYGIVRKDGRISYLFINPEQWGHLFMKTISFSCCNNSLVFLWFHEVCLEQDIPLSAKPKSLHFMTFK